jgi:hypothetical protein
MNQIPENLKHCDFCNELSECQQTRPEDMHCFVLHSKIQQAIEQAREEGRKEGMKLQRVIYGCTDIQSPDCSTCIYVQRSVSTEPCKSCFNSGEEKHLTNHTPFTNSPKE